VLVNTPDLLEVVAIQGDPVAGPSPVVTALNLVVQGRFFPIFAFLFGAGVSMFLANVERRDDRPYVRMFRRLAVLAVFGFLHSLIYPGEVLLSYAVVGVLVMGAHRLPTAAVVTLGVILTAASAALHFGVAATPGLMLLGMAVGRTDLLRRPGRHRPALITTLTLATVVSIGLFALVDATRGNAQFEPWPAAVGIIMATAYVSGFALLSSTAAGRIPLRLLAPFGRMALSNYLTQTVVLVGIHATVLPGHNNPSVGLAVALGLVASQLTASHWWLRHHRQGPVEALWRRLTYGRRAMKYGANGRADGVSERREPGRTKPGDAVVVSRFDLVYPDADPSPRAGPGRLHPPSRQHRHRWFV
jgi:uncharacterized membrane protein YeiB